jgi:hypothetical protein
MLGTILLFRLKSPVDPVRTGDFIFLLSGSSAFFAFRASWIFTSHFTVSTTLPNSARRLSTGESTTQKKKPPEGTRGPYGRLHFLTLQAARFHSQLRKFRVVLKVTGRLNCLGIEKKIDLLGVHV